MADIHSDVLAPPLILYSTSSLGLSWFQWAFANIHALYEILITSTMINELRSELFKRWLRS